MILLQDMKTNNATNKSSFDFFHCVLSLCEQINYTINGSVGRWRESVTVQKDGIVNQMNKRFTWQLYITGLSVIYMIIILTSISQHLFPPPKDIWFSIIEDDRNKKISTFNKLESENFCLLFHKKMTQTYKLIIQIVRMNLIADNSSINQLIVTNVVWIITANKQKTITSNET